MRPTNLHVLALTTWLLLVALASVLTLLTPAGWAEAQAEVPAEPTGLEATEVAHDRVALAWDDPGDDSITGYQVLRRSRDGDEYGDGLGSTEFVAIVEDTAAPATTYTDTTVGAGTRYAYSVKARNANGLSEPSDSVDVETAGAPPETEDQPGETCPAPTPVEVPVTAVPVVVESTTEDYFVLYASHSLTGETPEYPVRVVLGEEGTTTLSEHVPPLPAERYRVEKYSIDDPADVDGDCIDDITELNDLGPMNPLTPSPAIDPSLGALAIPDQETFESLAYVVPSGTLHVKYTIVHRDTERPHIYFQDTGENLHHGYFLDDIGLRNPGEGFELEGVTEKGMITYDPELLAPDGSRGRYRFTVNGAPRQPTYPLRVLRTYTMLAASMPVIDGDLSFWVNGWQIGGIQEDLPFYRSSRLPLVFDEEIYGKASFTALNPGEGYGLLRSLDADELPDPHDVVIYESLPNELPRVSGIITTVRQTTLSHVNLRAIQDGIPNAYIADALDDEVISGLIDSHVHYAVTDSGYTIRAATQEEVDEHYDASRPADTQTPQRDLSVTSITPLSEIGFDDWESFGVKAANVAVLGALELPDGTVPDGFAVPFHFYDEFMKHNGLYDEIREMLEDPDFQTDSDTQVSELKKLRKKIKKAETPEWIDTALTEMHENFPKGTSLRYRSSTNNEDLPAFNGAGLYDSKTQHPEETLEDGISKSLKQVYASLWNYRAFVQRDFHRIDHMQTAMGVLVHPNYSDERVNGVAVSSDPAYGTEGTHYVNSQLGEDLVTNPEAHSTPEEVLLNPDGTYSIVALSNRAPSGKLLMTDDQLAELRGHLDKIHAKFAELYGVEEGEEFAMEIEFKITSGNILSIKQARPWLFSAAPPGIQAYDTGEAGSVLTASVEWGPTEHDGTPFSVRIKFSELTIINNPRSALTVSGGEIRELKRQRTLNGDAWEIEIGPHSRNPDVTMVVANNQPCASRSGVCTYNGQRLLNRLEYTVTGLVPRSPDWPSGRARSANVAELSWNELPRADYYQVQFRSNDQWTMLPANGTAIEFDGAEAVITGLPASDAHHLRVRAVNSHGASGWSIPLLIRFKIDWESDFTPSRSTDLSPVMSGYSAFGNLGGELSPDSFELAGTTYTVKFLVYSPGSLWLGVHPELPADFYLRVGDALYLGSDSRISRTPSGMGGYWWPAEPPDLVENDPVPVSLLTYPGEPLEERRNAPITGEFRYFPAEHNGSDPFSIRIYFSEPVDITADAMRDHVLSVAEGTLTQVKTVDFDGRIWEAAVSPHGRKDVTVRIESGLDCALPGAICASDGRRLYNRMKLVVAMKEYNPPTGTPTIIGEVDEGRTLSVDASGIADADGLTTATFSYQWVSYDGRGYKDMPGENATTYTVRPSDEGKAFRVRVTFTDDAGFAESVDSPLAYSKKPYGLRASESDGAVRLVWNLPAGNSAVTAYRILRHRPELGESEPLVHVEFTDNASRNYTDTAVDSGVLYVYRVQAADYLGETGPASEPAPVRVGSSNSPATGAPSINGVAQVGETLTADTSGMSDADGMAGATFSYRWLADDTAIDDATGFSHTLADSEEGKAVKVRVSFTDDGGNDETLTSAATDAVAPAPVPLTAQFLDIPASHDGQTAFTFELRFSENLPVSYRTLRDHAFAATGGEVTNARRLERDGSAPNIRWEITVVPNGNGDVHIVLPETADCEAQGAICTSDGRRLSNRNELTISSSGQ